jgi:predicted O-methyltransferase YrrM
MRDWIECILSAWKGHRSFAEWLVKECGMQTVVELGVDRGYSTFCFANAGAKVYGIDLWEPYPLYRYDNYKPLLETMIVQHGLQDRVQLIRGEFGQVSTTWSHGMVDLLHIDGTHEYDHVKADFNNWEKFVHDNGIILMHDVCVHRFTVKPFFNEITQYPKGWFQHSAGLGVVCKNQQTLEKIAKTFPNFRIGNVV